MDGDGRSRGLLPVCLLADLTLVALRMIEHREVLPLLTYNLKWPVIAVGVGAGLILVLTRPPRALQWHWLVWIGKISYGVYIIHALFGQWLHLHFSLQEAPLIFVIQLGVTLPLAAASWYLFELPLLKFKRYSPMPSGRRAPVRR